MERITWAAILAKLGPMSDHSKSCNWPGEPIPNSDEMYPTLRIDGFNNFQVFGKKNGQLIRRAFFTATEAERFLEQEWPLG